MAEEIYDNENNANIDDGIKNLKLKKNHNKRNVIIAIIITAIITCAATNFIRDNIMIYLPSSSSSKNFTNKLALINKVLQSKYLYDIDEEELSENAITAYVEGLDEPYTHYYTPEMFSSYMTNLQDSYVGIGIVISQNENNEIEIVAPFEGSPAYNAGVMPGDIISAVDGTAYSGDKMDEAVNYIRGGERGTTVTLTLIRDGGAPFDITVERGNVSQESVKAEMLDNKIGYVRITAFNTADEGGQQDTYTEFKEKVTELQNNGMEKMIIDLRDNPGGALDVVCNIADMIVPEGTITYMEYKDGKRETFTSDANEINMPIAVIINENSASASEVLTGCLKDYKKAIIVGKKSYGKGIVQTVYPFMDGSGMSVTVAKYYSPNGVCIHGTGIEPDIQVDLPEQYEGYYASMVPREQDTQLNKAIEAISN